MILSVFVGSHIIVCVKNYVKKIVIVIIYVKRIELLNMNNCVAWFFILSADSSNKICKWKLHNMMINIVISYTVQKWKKKKKNSEKIYWHKWKDFLNPIMFFIAGKWFCPGWAWLIETYYSLKWAVDMIIKTQHLHSLYNILTFTFDYKSSCLHFDENPSDIFRKGCCFSACGFDTVMSW